MDIALKLHPDYACDAVKAIHVSVARSGALVALRYVVTGTIADLLIAPAAQPERRDGLWQHSCFEVFARAPGDACYREFNFAPSGEWAAYRFAAYRSGMALEETPPPRIRTAAAPERFALEAEVALEPGPLRLALSAVIEERGGRKSYWALAHPEGKADFHHPDSFAYELP